MKFISTPPYFGRKSLYFRCIFTIFCLGICAVFSAQSPEDIEKLNGRIGINTNTPRATLEIHKKDPSELVAGVAQGVIFPRFTTEERRQFAYEELTDGLMIYNLTKKCIELCFDYEGKLIWKCLSRSEPHKIMTNDLVPDNPLIRRTFTLSYSGYEYHLGNPLPMVSWPERIVEKEVVIGGQTETLVLTIPAGSVNYGSSIYLENVELKTKSGNPLDLTDVPNYERFVSFGLFLDEDSDIYLEVAFMKYQSS